MAAMAKQTAAMAATTAAVQQPQQQQHRSQNYDGDAVTAAVKIVYDITRDTALCDCVCR